MTSTPSVSIVMPLFNDAEWVASAIESCLRQTLTDIEVICVDDASTDDTAEIVARYQRADARVRLVRHSENRSAFQARRSGIEVAAAPYILFLDGDDELAPAAAQRTLDHAIVEQADIVGFGVDVVAPDGTTGGRFQDSLQPEHKALYGLDIVPAIFPVGKVAQGHLWRNLYRVEVLQEAYSGLSTDLTLHRANDLPITFRAFAAASKYTSICDRLYRYHFRRGISGRRIDGLERFQLYLGAVDSIDAVRGAVDAKAKEQGEASGLAASYDSARLSIIGNVLRYSLDSVSPALQDQCIELLCARAGELSVVRAAAAFCGSALETLSRRASKRVPSKSPVRTVLLKTGNLQTGGVQGVLVAQVKHFIAAGYAVTVAVEDASDVAFTLPETVELIEIPQGSLADRLRDFAEICIQRDVDVVIDHHILYQDRWPYYALAAGTIGTPTIGWLHNFALRTVRDFSTRGTFLRTHLPLLQKVVTLSATDVAFWRLRGVQNVVFLPNPLSPLLLENAARTEPKARQAGPIRLVWWGRLQQSTKQVRELIRVASELRALDVDFELTIIGPDSKELHADDLAMEASRCGIGDAVTMRGPLYGADLVSAIAQSDVYVSTSVVEGFPLTIVESQSLGLPVVMYDLPWLAFLAGNEGVLTVEQGDARALAGHLARLAGDPELYLGLSKASLAAAARLRSIDYPRLYSQLVNDRLPEEHAPEPTLDDARLLLEWIFFFSDRNVRAQARATSRRERDLLRREAAVREQERKFELQIERLQRQTEALRGSLSFRLGRGLTSIPRAIHRRWR